jgi:hypothetical protein
MIKRKIEKIIVISFIVLIGVFLVGLNGNIVLKAGSPDSDPKPEVNIEERLRPMEDDLQAGKITRREFDSLADVLRAQIKGNEAVEDNPHILDKMPEWVSKLGIPEPQDLVFDKDFSSFTSVDNPQEGFNSVSLIYTGTYANAVEQAARIAASAGLSAGGNFMAKGNPSKQQPSFKKNGVRYLNYSLDKTKQDFLISVEAEASGRLTLVVTDNKQLNKCLLAYAPLNNRENRESKRKKL